jgi:hypothetical protein
LELCLDQIFSSANRPCVGFDSVAGIAANLTVLIALGVLLTLVVRVVRAVRGECPANDDEVKRIVLRGLNPWLFVGGYVLWFAAFLLTRVAA